LYYWLTRPTNYHAGYLAELDINSVKQFGFTPAYKRWWTLITSLFLHKNLGHLLGNLFFLWIVGDNIEEVLGPFRFTIVYLICGIPDHLFLFAIAPNSYVTLYGASSAISGLIGMYFCFFPLVKIDLELWCLFWNTGRKFSAPAFLLIPLWILLQFLLVFDSSSNVFHFGHFIGAITGIILGKFFVRMGAVDKFWANLDERCGARKLRAQ